jgi:hypothetical protein
MNDMRHPFSIPGPERDELRADLLAASALASMGIFVPQKPRPSMQRSGRMFASDANQKERRKPQGVILSVLSSTFNQHPSSEGMAKTIPVSSA